MPQVVITQNTAAQNGANGTVVSGINDVRIWADQPDTNQYLYGNAGFSRSAAGVAQSHQLYYPSGIMHAPARAAIGSAFLEFVTSPAGASSGAITVQAQQLAARPEVTRATWNDRGLEKPWTTAGGDVSGPALGSAVVDSDDTWYSIDVTAWAQSVNDGNFNTGVGLFAQDGDPHGLRFIESGRAADGRRPQLVINYTDGFTDANLPRQESVIDFTGTDGDPAPSPLTNILSDHQIVSNQLEAVGTQETAANGYSAFQVGAETNTADGITRIEYDPKGGTGSLSGAMIRCVEAGKFIDVIMTNTDELSCFVVHPTGGVGETRGVFALPAGTFAAGKFFIDVHHFGDFIDVYHLDVLVFSTVTSTYNDATIHGAKYIAAGAAATDNWSLPKVPPVAPVVDAAQVFNIPENSTAAFGPVAITAEPESVPTAYTIEGAEFTIDSSGNITPATAKDYAGGTSYTLAVTVTDQFGVSESVNITINITDVNEAATPTIDDIGVSFRIDDARNVAGGLVSAISATNADSFQLGGADAASFQLDGTNLELVGEEGEGALSATITAIADDPDAASALTNTAVANISLVLRGLPRTLSAGFYLSPYIQYEDREVLKWFKGNTMDLFLNNLQTNEATPVPINDAVVTATFTIDRDIAVEGLDPVTLESVNSNGDYLGKLYPSDIEKLGRVYHCKITAVSAGDESTFEEVYKVKVVRKQELIGVTFVNVSSLIV